MAKSYRTPQNWCRVYNRSLYSKGESLEFHLYTNFPSKSLIETTTVTSFKLNFAGVVREHGLWKFLSQLILSDQAWSLQLKELYSGIIYFSNIPTKWRDTKSPTGR